MERIAATGLTMPFPDISGAEPSIDRQQLSKKQTFIKETYRVSAHRSH